MVDSTDEGRPRLLGAALLLAVTVGACGSGATGADPAAGGRITTTAATTTAAAVESTVTAPDEVLASAISATSGYLFQSTVSIDGAIVTVVSGKVDAGGMEATVSSGGAEVEYLATDTGRWSRRSGGQWLALSGTVPFSDPLAVLADPDSVSVVGADPLTLVATYPSAALGVDGDASIPVEIAVDAGRVARMSYVAPTGGRIAEVETMLAPRSSPTPITAPAA